MDTTKLAKVLARAASDNEAEAVRALHLAKRILAGMGLDFVDIANLMTEAPAPDNSTELDDLKARLLELRREVRQLKGENRRLRSGAPAPTAPMIATLAELEQRLIAEGEARKTAESANGELAQCILKLEQDSREISGQLSQMQTMLQSASDEILRLAREARQLKAGTECLNAKLEHSETERYRLAALTRQLSLGRGRNASPFRSPRSRPHRQYTLFDLLM